MAGSANTTAHVADQASPYLVGQKKESPGRSLTKKPFTRNEAICIYPNPVTDGRSGSISPASKMAAMTFNYSA